MNDILNSFDGGRKAGLSAADEIVVNRNNGTQMVLGASLTGTGAIIDASGAVHSLSPTSAYVTLTATGAAFVGPCTLAGWYCSVAAGNITIYDAASATGTAFVPAEATAVGPRPINGAGTNSRVDFVTGCWVVLSGAATVRIYVE